MSLLRRKTDYGRVLPTHRWQGRSRLRRLWDALKWWLATALLVGVLWYFLGGTQRIGPEQLPPPSSAEMIQPPFTRCGRGRAANCVVDGDTIMVGQRTIRVIGIDAPEIHPPRCPDEAAKGEAAANELLRLANQAPLTLAGPQPPVRDEYGRELRHLLRARADGTVQSLADDLVAGQFVRPYLRGPRDPWC